MKQKNRIELLAPAGNTESFIAAVEAGADAVYCGGHVFNARMGAGNFSDEELAQAIAFAHKRAVQVHVTLNTLLKDEELPEALDFARRVYEMGADALIVQDLGLARLLRRELPELPLHTSTQGSVYDLAGVKAAASLGFTRVVLARELSLNEILEITAASPVEIEVFGHGALCICYSGQCQMSRAIGGRSGNRGGCAQPCRLAYRALDAKGKELRELPYPLSPADYCTIERLPELAAAGVASLKLEGRAKSPEYVAVITSLYRKYLDRLYEKGSYEVAPEDMSSLQQIFYRGFTTAYLDGTQAPDMMSGDLSKHKGLLIGEVVDPQAGRNLVDCRLRGRLAMGDGVEIRGGERRAGNVVTYLAAEGKQVRVAGGSENGRGKEAVYRIGDIKEAVRKGDLVYRISSKEQLEEAAGFFRGKTFRQGNYRRRLSLTADCTGKDGKLLLALKEKKTGLMAQYQVGPFPESADGSTCEERLRTALSKTGGTPYIIESIRLHGDMRLSAPVAALNALRREALLELEQKMAVHAVRLQPVGEPGKPPLDAAGARPDQPTAGEEAVLELCFYDLAGLAKRDQSGELAQAIHQAAARGVKARVLLPAAEAVLHPEELTRICAGRSVPVFPYVTNIAKGKEAAFVRAHRAELAALCQAHGSALYVGNLSWVDLAGESPAAGVAPIPLRGDTGFNIYNEETRKVLAGLGIREAVFYLEEGERYSGALPLMITQHESPAAALIDRKKCRYRLLRHPWSDQTLLIRETEPDVAALLTLAGERGGVVRAYYR
ncbi:MAG: U32 family peptidase [Firmicutes bacterium]|nr:U32 family peptidase [Bacillota bacterium]